jgi:hypothetical protein
MASLPSNLTLQSVTAAGGTCTSEGSSVTCSLGTLKPQETRQIDLTVVGNATGSSTATVSVASPNDYVASNNNGQVAIQISAATPPSAPVSTSSSGDSGSGGGGGGNLDLAVLATLAGVSARRLMRRRASVSQ